VFTSGKIGYDSIYRYKGQQSPSVILVDVDPDPGKLERAQRTLYCGMTRATVRLDIVANEANPENEVLFKRGA
jgi:superfamily I DNA and RNA helicase